MYSMSDAGQLCIDAGGLDTEIHTASFKDKTLYIDGRKAGTFSGETGLSSGPVYLFSWGGDLYYKGRIYRCRLSKENQTVRDFIPCIRKSDSEAGMFDIINAEFYPNQGSGSFGVPLKKPDLDEDFYDLFAEADYIETSGTQWIDTEVIGPAKWIYDIQYKNLDERQLMGHGGSGSEYWGITNGLYGKAEWSTSDIAAGGRDIMQINNFPGTEKAGTGEDVYINGVFAYKNAYDEKCEKVSAQMFAENGTFTNYCRLWRCLVYDINDNLIRDFIPAVRKSDGTAGLYDNVNKKFYQSQGSSVFDHGSAFIKHDKIIIGYDYSSDKIRCMPMRIFEAEIEKDGTKMKLIPALRNSDSRTGMFDIINGVFYPLSGENSTIVANTTHILGVEQVVKGATYQEDGLSRKICRICGAEICSVTPRTAFLVEFDYDDGVDEIRIQNSKDPADYTVGNKAYSRNAFSYNYSKINACVLLAIDLKEGYSVEIISLEGGTAMVTELDNQSIMITLITGDMKLNIKSRKNE